MRKKRRKKGKKGVLKNSNGQKKVGENTETGRKKKTKNDCPVHPLVGHARRTKASLSKTAMGPVAGKQKKATETNPHPASRQAEPVWDMLQKA